MKKIVAVSILLLFGGFAVAQDQEEFEVPQRVIQAFACLHPSIKNVDWEFDEVNYSASFKSEGRAVSVLFDEYGELIKVKNEIKLFELPLDVNHLISKEYSGWTIGHASHIASNGSTYYETVVMKEDQIIELVFNKHGGLLMKVLL